MRLWMTCLTLALFAGLFVATATAEDKEDAKSKAEEKNKQAIAKLFERLDSDNDGKISKEEFRKMMDTRLQGKAIGDKIGDRLGSLMDNMFSRLDADKDGYLTKEELEKMAGSFQGKAGDKFGADLKEKLKGLREKFKKRGSDD
jgi:Ca2+-binding EF-hand superfamily protein